MSRGIAGRTVALMRAIRVGEALLMLGFPAAAGVLGMRGVTPGALRAPLPVLAALVPIALSIYAFNTAVGFGQDRHDPKFQRNPLHLGSIRRGSLYAVTGGGALLGFFILAVAARRTVPVVGLLWLVWLAYSHPRGLKTMPGLATMAHLAAGTLMFAVPYVVGRPMDPRGLVLSLFFGLALASGHANHEAIDEPADRSSGVRTLAVRYGRRAASALNLVVAAAGYLVLASGLAAGTVEAGVALPFLAAALVHLPAGLRLRRRGLSTRGLCRYRTLYRTAFAAASAAACAWHLLGSPAP